MSIGFILSKGQGQCQVKLGHQIKMLHVTCDTCLFWVIRDVDSMMAFFFIWPKGNSGQIKSNLLFLSQKHAYLAQLYIRVPKLTFIFTNDNQTFPKSSKYFKKWCLQLLIHACFFIIAIFSFTCRFTPLKARWINFGTGRYLINIRTSNKRTNHNSHTLWWSQSVVGLRRGPC